MIKIIITRTGQPDVARWVSRVPCIGEFVRLQGNPHLVLDVTHLCEGVNPVDRPDITCNIVQAEVRVVG